jgi:alginate O-acetyltransferase complex protein AlgI
MPETSLQWIAWLLACLLLVRLVPFRRQVDAIACAGFAFMAVNAPWSAGVLAGLSLLTAWSVRRMHAGRGQLPLMLVLFSSSAVLLIHGLQAPSWRDGGISTLRLLGAAYFACRQIHVAFDAYAGRLHGVTLADQLRYQFFLPTLLVGPIHRIQPFRRACMRRRADAQDLYSGLERALFGAAKVAIVGNLLLEGVIASWCRSYAPSGYAGALLLGLVGWLDLYATFSGYSDIAIGFARAMGIPIEENFQRPWAAGNIIDFWRRWHITLSLWCRDYVYYPLAAATRHHAISLLAAMLVMGLWHSVSAYYLVWGSYHALGIVLCRLLQRAEPVRAMSLRSPAAMSAAARIATFAWLAGSAPTVTWIVAAFTHSTR